MYHVTVVTGTRAEYGLLRPVLQKMQQNPELSPQLVVTGTHLSQDFGHTVNEIEADGFPIAARVDILSASVPPGRLGTARRTALALDSFAALFAQNKPDAVLLLGDRYEIFAAAQGAALLDIPVVHISGGDVTYGADDDWFRHCITKMAKLHFPSCEVYRQRVIRMGEMPSRVFNVGGLGDENIRQMQLLSPDEVQSQLALPAGTPYALVTFHPETATGQDPAQQVQALLDAIAQYPQLYYLFTKANADAGGLEMNRMLEAYCATHSNAALFSSLGVLRYLSAMKYAALVLGNSSSGVVETPSFGVPCVNIGQRQTGRVMSDNILNCGLDTTSIAQAIQAALTPEFAAWAHTVKSPYNGGDTSGMIVSTLLAFLQNGALQKPKFFYDGK